MKRHLLRGLVVLCALWGAGAVSLAGVVVSHVGSADPATEGWTLNDYTGLGGAESPGADTEAFWRIQSNPGAVRRYLYAPTAADVSDSSGWTYTARIKVNAANQVFEASFGVIENNDWWNVHLVAGTAATGVWLIDTNANPSVQLSTIDPAAAYHTYQIVYDPAANGGAGGVTYYLNGSVIGTRARGAGYQVPGLTRLDFGDVDRGNASSDSQWSLVRFETGQHPLTNDACTGAIALGDGLVSGFTLGAGAEGHASCQSTPAPDVWYAYTASCTGTARINTCGSGFDTLLSIYSGSCGSLTEVECSNDCAGSPCGGTSSCATFAATQGQTYFVRVSGADGQSGDFVLKASCGVPLNDTCAQATPVGPGSTLGTTLGATSDAGASCGNSGGSPDVWYSYTSAVNGTLKIDTCNATFDTVLSVLDACGGTELACNDHCAGAPCAGPGSCLSVPVSRNHTYLIRVAGAGGAKGDFTLTLQDDAASQWSLVYQEVFSSAGTKRLLSFAGWSWINPGGVDASPPVSSNPAVSAAGGPPVPAEGSVNSSPAIPDGTAGYIYAGAPFVDAYGLLYTQEYPIQRVGITKLRFSWSGNSDAVSSARLALRIAGAWFVSDPEIPGVFADWPMVGPLDPDALQWKTLNYTPGSSLAVGAATALPVGDISAFGVFISGIDSVTQGNYRLDNFRVEELQFADECANAVPIHVGTTRGSTALASPGGTASCGNSTAAADVWYVYTATTSTQLTIDTCGSAFDTVLSVYAGCGGAELACNDNTCDSGSRVSLPVQQGSTYYIRAGGAGGGGGTFVLHVGRGVVANDQCAAAQVIGNGVVTGTTLGASNDGTASCGNSSTSADVWYSYTSTCTAPLEINTAGSDFDTVLSVLTGCGGAEVACDDNGLGKQSKVEFPTTAGTNYLIRVSGNNHAQGTVRLNVICKTPPPNDACASAVAIADEGTTNGTTLYATNDGDAPCGDSGGSPDVWYMFTAPKAGELLVKANATEFSPVVSVHNSPTCPGNLENAIACGAPSTALSVAQGQQYLIRVAGASGSSGAFGLVIAYSPIVIEHIGLNDPATEGWTLNDYTGLGGVETPGTDTEDYWRIHSYPGAVQRYLATIGSSTVSDPRGWTYTARVKVSAANQILEASFGLIDGAEWWQLHFLRGGTPETTGVFLMNPDASTGPQLSPIDPGTDYHTYQIVFDPNGGGGQGQATYYMDGAAIGTRLRGENFSGGVSGLYRLDFGDIDRGNAESDSQWSLVRFEIGRTAVCPKPFADVDGDKDVDMDDFGEFQRCYTGISFGIADGCSCFDRNSNGGIDNDDFLKFTACRSGPAIPANPACGD